MKLNINIIRVSQIVAETFMCSSSQLKESMKKQRRNDTTRAQITNILYYKLWQDLALITSPSNSIDSYRNSASIVAVTVLK